MDFYSEQKNLGRLQIHKNFMIWSIDELILIDISREVQKNFMKL